MDTSETYIKMCIQAWPDISKSCNPILPLFSRRRRMLYTDGEVCRRWDDAVNAENHSRWYPLWEQDQLQEMLGGGLGLLASIEGWSWDHYDHGEKQAYPDYECPRFLFDTWEQLWLAFVMDKKHSKQWNDTQWVNGGADA